MENDPKVLALAQAIATAEGFYRADANVKPRRLHNPGDLTAGGVVREFATDAEGWAALYHQVRLILYGGSAYYDAAMSIREIAASYTETEQDAWARNVALALGISPDLPLADWLVL